ncbi:hypothetical protein ALC60_06528 [Trachymyrmex zeteki]|uniref:Uncharacterized protein n=1 Tax=Mycetomoellerius zeteki TaxID=64791 RepID=A0A151X2L0_9HYME|nr:hypothetical protein ALC60_06528 [Trachymyrmex zeteki]
MKNRVCRGGSHPPPRAEVSRRLRLRDSPTLRDLGNALSPAKANLLDGNTCEPGTSLYVSVCVSMQYYVSKELLKREARTSGFRCWDSRLLEEYRRMSFHTAKPIADSGTYWDSITATSAKHAIPTPLKDYPSRCYITKKKNLPRGTFTQITTTTHFSLRISVSKLCTTYRNAHRDWPPSIIQSLYQHDVCYRDVIKCPAVQATTPSGISTHPLSVSRNNIPFHLKRRDLIQAQQRPLNHPL